ncbi:MAG: hypothetical protein LBL39_06730 [Planctomycetaceae bacterium]|jgi:hypothetical protein|nr:hypothetical protein [Planctomycetaceae bacterium]
MRNRYLVSVILVILVTFVLVDFVGAQSSIRRLVRKILESDAVEPYRVERQEDEQGNNQNLSEPNRIAERNKRVDRKRLLERTMRTINLIANNGKELKPVIVVSLASFDDYKKTMNIVTEKIRKERGNNERPVVFDGILNLYEQFISKHFDTKQPFGLILQTDGILYYPLVFMPLNSDSDVIRKLGSNYVEELDDGRYAIKQDAFKWALGRLYVQKHNGWIFIATEFQLNSLPDDPSKLLPQSDEPNNLLTARFDLKNVPQLTTRAALSLAEADAVSRAETTIDKATARLSIGHIRALAEQAEFLEYSFSYDEEKNDYVIRELEIARPNTEQAKLLQQRRDVVSPFHSFYLPENAILASHLAFNMTKLQRSQYEVILDEAIGQYLLTPDERQELNLKKAKQKLDKKTTDISVAQNPQNIQTDSRDRLATLLTLENNGEKDINEINNGESYLPEFHFADEGSDVVEGKNGDVESTKKLSEKRKFEIMLRRIGVCYYWGLLGSIRSGKFDIATTWSDEYGIIGAFKITEGERFQKAFDLMFSDMAKEFPDIYSANVRKDYRQLHGFKLTRVSVKLADLLRGTAAEFFVTDKIDNGGVNILLAVRKDAVCYSIRRASDLKKQEQQLEYAIESMEKSLPVYNMFFVFSAYELGKTYANSGNQNQFQKLKSIAANTSPNAIIYATTEFTENSKLTTIRANAILTPSLWRLRENFKLSEL